jgi:hypothetical protein
MSNEEKKIIIDEDWKTQVQAEKEAMARKSPPEAAPERPAAARDDQPHGPLPEPTLADLCTLLGTQAMIALGTYADPNEGGKPEHLDQAKYFIDMLSLLEAKTQGNRTPEEIAILSQTLHELRMTYLRFSTRSPG